MDPQAPLRILCLDGGGVKGLSSLYILKELMLQVRRNVESRSRQKAPRYLRPCDYFDLICGTGTGGILAIMLGRLQYDIETAIEKYASFATVVFETSSSEDRALFDAATLEKEILKVIRASPDGSKEDSMFEDPRVTADTKNCRTFVLASRPEGLGKSAVRMRSYATQDSDPFQAQIWQVGRATSAAPTYFLPIDINGIRYGDGRIGWDNPTMEAIIETNHLWPSRPIACVVSVGTGLEDAIQLTTESKSPSISGVLGQLFRSLTPKQAFELLVAQYCVSCVTSCERTHGQVVSNLGRYGIDGPWQYVRLNVPQGMAKIGLQEWKKLQMIAAMTQDYVEDIDVRELKRQVAERLISPDYYAFPSLAAAPPARREPLGRIGYTSSPVNHPRYAATMQDSALSNALVRQQIPSSSRQQEALKVNNSESSSDESGRRRNRDAKESKRNLVEAPRPPDLMPNTANRGRLRHPPTMEISSPPVDMRPSGLNYVPGQSKVAAYCQDQDQIFDEYFNCDGLSATVLCCDYPECWSMGALQKDYLKNHYVSYHDESLIKPSEIIPHAISMTYSRPLRCSACLRKLMDENRGRKCDNCQRFEPMRDAAMSNLLNSNSTEQKAPLSLAGIHTLSQNVPTGASNLLYKPSSESMGPPKNVLTGDEHSASPVTEEADGSMNPQPSFWTPPEIPDHWTSYTSSAPRRVNANTGSIRSHPLSLYSIPYSMPNSVRKAREEYRRQRFYHENKSR